MPLQGKSPFKRKTPKGVAHLDQELFFCKTTNEVFTDYEDLFERAIQCSSLFWTCALTGRGGLTFQEACESENKARKVLQSIPLQLKALILQQVARCKASRLQDLNDKVFMLIQSRFVVGETVDVMMHGVKKTCEITEVRPPGSIPKNKSPTKKSNESLKMASPSKLRYEVCEKDADVQVLHVVSPDSLSRPKGALSKDKCKLVLKQCINIEDGILKVKDSLVQKYQLNLEVNTHSPAKKAKVEKNSKTASPVKTHKTVKSNTSSKVSTVKSALKNSQSPSKLKKTLKSIDADIRKMFPKKAAKLSQQSKENNPICTGDLKLVNDLKLEEEKKKKRDDLREKRRIETKLLNKYFLEWKKRRDDLECDDLKDLPLPTPINCGIPRDNFSEAIAIMEFLHQFSAVLQVKNTFPGGLKFETMEKAMTNTDIQGPFSDILQLLLLAVFKQQDSEEEEPDTSKPKDKVDLEASKTVQGLAVQNANAAAIWSTHYLGCRVRQFPLDPFTLTELLRLHFLASGAEITTVDSDRGHFRNTEDPGLAFKIQYPEIMKKLATTSVFLLFPEERLKVLTVLTEQLLTYPFFRDILDKADRNLKKARNELVALFRERRRLLKSTEPSNEKENTKGPEPSNEKENTKEPESILSNPENTDIPILLEAKESQAVQHVMTDDERYALQQIERKVKDLKYSINRIHTSFRVESLGSDRAHRNFWLFRSVDGLFVEDCNPYAGQCLQRPTPTQLTINGCLSQDELPLPLMDKFFRLISNSHDKENNLPKLNKQKQNSPQKKMLSNLNGLAPLKSGKKENVNSDKKITRVFGMCSANPATCLVHGSNPNRVTWAFYHNQKDLDSLMDGLNSRGYREFNLKRNLLQEKVKIADSMVKCLKNKLNVLEQNSEEETVDQRKSVRLQGDKSEFVGIHPEEALESTLRDAILDNEDKIWSGGIGALKVKDRDAWRLAIENNSYDSQCDETFDEDESPSNSLTLEMSDEESVSSQPITQDFDQVPSTSSSPSPPASSSRNVKDLCKALIQVADSIEPRCFIKPLGVVYRKRNSRDVPLSQSPMRKWRISVLKCTSLSQVFLHLITLEKSISWDRSALKASCKMCRKSGDAEKMLLCDKCDLGFHLYCLKPPLMEIPEGNWFCVSCTNEPKEKTSNERKARRTLNYKDPSSGDEDEDEEGDDDEDDDSEMASESEKETEYEPKEKKAKQSKIEEDQNSNKCTACHKGGQLICCDGCPESLHLSCVKPPLRRVPRGKWYCQKCLKKNKRASLNHSTDSSTGTRSSTRKLSQETSEPQRSSSGSSRQTRSDLLDVSACEDVLENLIKHPDSWPFGSGKKKADYKRIVKRPVDLHSIRGKLNGMSYSSSNQFVGDVYLMFQNCELLNSTGSEEYESSKRLSRYFQTLLRRYKIKDVNESDLLGKRPKRSL